MTADVIEQEAPPTREQIVGFECYLREQRERPRIEIETKHTFGPGFYARTIVVPAGATITGKVHATEHIFILSRGVLAVVTEDGRQLLRAPFQCVAREGLKRVGHALTECEVTNVHITTETDLERLESLLIVPEAIECVVPGELVA